MSSIDSRPPLESDLLRTFLAVAREGSVSRAAELLLRTQSAVSLQVQKLENTVGQQLFVRHHRGVALAPAGEALLPTARSVIAMLDKAAADLHGLHIEGEIRIGVPDEYGEAVLATALARFSASHPTAGVTVHCGSSRGFAEALVNGRLDMALYSPERVARGDRVVRLEKAVWAGSTFHNAEERRPLQVALFDKTCWWRDRSMDLLEKAGIPYRIACTSESVAGVRAAISSGMAVGVLPQSALTPDLRILRSEALPHLGESPVVLGVSAEAPKALSDAMAVIVEEVFGSLAHLTAPAHRSGESGD